MHHRQLQHGDRSSNDFAEIGLLTLGLMVGISGVVVSSVTFSILGLVLMAVALVHFR